MLDKEPPADAKAKHAKASQQDGWTDAFMEMNLRADELATKAMKTATGLHGKIADREKALGTAQRISAEIATAVAKRLLTARLPRAAADLANPTLAETWARTADASHSAADGIIQAEEPMHPRGPG